MAQPDTHRESDSPQRYTNSRVYRWLDNRFDLNAEILGKAFPEDKFGSFLLGEVALFCFVILAATGTFLGLLYTPVATDSFQYTGQVVEYAGKTLPGAFASVLRLTYDVRMGMYIRMMHHWASYIFIAAIVLHMFRIFFSGVYRNPREPNWLIGSTLLLLSLAEGFLGYALPYDNFSLTATGIGFTLTQSIPFIGSRLANLIFGGNFPSNAQYVMPRLFFFHVFLIPAVLAILIAAHLAILVRQKHTEQKSARTEDSETPQPGDDSVVMGVPFFPNQVAMSVVAFFFTAAIISFLAALFPLQRIAIFGPASPFTTPENVAPAWFFVWTYGSLKLAVSALGTYGTFVFGALLPGLLVGAMYLWVFVDRSEKPIHFTENPLDRPLPTAVGVGVIALLMMLSIAGMNETVAETLGTTTGALKHPLQILTVVVPVVEGAIVYMMLQRRQNRKRNEATPQPGSTGRTADTSADD
jgi:cytochrome b-561